VSQYFSHHAWQRCTVKIADMNPAAALRRGSPGELRPGLDLGKMDGELQMKVGEGLLHEPGHFLPSRLERRMIEV
jgi:hypothetical protein